MPYFLDRHDALDASPDQLARIHELDLSIQERFGVNYLTYWFDYQNHRANCLVEAPDAAAAMRVHEAAHGQLANKIIEVDPAAIAVFLGRTGDPVQLPISEPATRTLVFTDMVGSTEQIDRLGDETGLAILREHDQVVRALLADHNGREVKHTGDGFMLVFDSPSAAVRFSIELQQRLSDRPPDAPSIVIRIGIHAGEPVAEGDQFFGAAVNLAARICQYAKSGTILASHVVRGLTMGKGFAFIDCGTATVKGFSEPVSISEVDWRR